jgi:hypothetical protein
VKVCEGVCEGGCEGVRVYVYVCVCVTVCVCICKTGYFTIPLQYGRFSLFHLCESMHFHSASPISS